MKKIKYTVEMTREDLNRLKEIANKVGKSTRAYAENLIKEHIKQNS